MTIAGKLLFIAMAENAEKSLLAIVSAMYVVYTVWSMLYRQIGIEQNCEDWPLWVMPFAIAAMIYACLCIYKHSSLIRSIDVLERAIQKMSALPTMIDEEVQCTLADTAETSLTESSRPSNAGRMMPDQAVSRIMVDSEVQCSSTAEPPESDVELEKGIEVSAERIYTRAMGQEDMKEPKPKVHASGRADGASRRNTSSCLSGYVPRGKNDDTSNRIKKSLSC